MASLNSHHTEKSLILYYVCLDKKFETDKDTKCVGLLGLLLRFISAQDDKAQSLGLANRLFAIKTNLIDICIYAWVLFSLECGREISDPRSCTFLSEKTWWSLLALLAR